MRKHISLFPVMLITLVLSFSMQAAEKEIRALLITGGCCHDYAAQKSIIPEGVSKRANVRWTVVHQGGSTTDTKIPFYNDPDWAKGYDIVVHNECFAGVTDVDWLERVLKPHRAGLPGVVIHCAMHCYRANSEEWFKFCGVTSRGHGAHYPYVVEKLGGNHPIMDGLPDKWKTPQGELYNIEKVWPSATPLAQGLTLDGGTNVNIWINDFNGTRVFGTTMGHHNETMQTEEFLTVVTRGILWATKHLDDPDYQKPHAGVAVDMQYLDASAKAAAVQAKVDSAEFAEGKVPNNLAAGKPAKAVNSQDGHPPTDINDKNLKTRWCAPDNGKGYWVQVDLEAPQSITGVRMVWEQDDRDYRYKVEGSADETNWKMLVDMTGHPVKKQLDTQMVKADDVRFVRLTAISVPDGSWMSLFDLAVFGTKTGTWKESGLMPFSKNGTMEGGTDASAPTPPDGFESTIFAKPPIITYPACLAATPEGDVYVGIDQNGSLGKSQEVQQRIVRCRDTDGDGQADVYQIFADKVGNVRGLFARGNKVWALHPPLLRVFTDDDGDGFADRNEVLVSGLGTEELSKRGADHCTNGFRLGIDGWMYIAVGDFGCLNLKGTDGTAFSFMGGGILRVRLDGTGLEVYSRGLRNIYDVAVDPFLNCFTRDNTNDGGGWNVRFNYDVQGAQYGYPTLYQNFADDHLPTLKDYGGGSGTGAAYFDEPGLPEGFGNAVYTCDWGTSWIYRHNPPVDGAGFKADQSQFLQITRPTDIDIDGQSRMYIASWKGATFSYGPPDAGFVTMLRPTAGVPAQAPPVRTLSDSDLVKQLASNSAVRREYTQLEILERGAKPTFTTDIPALIESDAAKAGRVAALFTWKQLMGSKATPQLNKWAKDPVLGEFAMRALTDRLDQLEGVDAAMLTASLTDPNPRVRVQAAVSLGRLGQVTLAPSLIAATVDGDEIVRHSAVQALVRLEAVDVCLAALQDGKIADKSGVYRAIRSIHRLDAVDGLIKLLTINMATDQRLEALTALARLYFVEKEWTGSWWNTRPDTRGPYYYPTEWEGSARIKPVLAAALADAAIAAEVRPMLSRHRIVIESDPESIITAALGDGNLRDMALAMLRVNPSSSPAALKLLEAVAADAKASVKQRATALAVLGEFGDDAALFALRMKLLAAVGNGDEAYRQQRARLVYDNRNGSRKEALLAALKDKDAGVAALAGEALLALGTEGGIAAVQARIKNSDAEQDKRVIASLKPAEVADAVGKAKGDADHGRDQFYARNCVMCHTLGEYEVQKGPMLGFIAKQYGRPEITASIMDPNAVISQGFHSAQVTTKDGKDLLGFVSNETGDTIEVRDIAGNRHVVKTADIKERKELPMSIMPPGLMAPATVYDFASLLAYLELLAGKK